MTVFLFQDGKGGIWKLDLSTSLNAAAPEEIYQCHSGRVLAVQASPISTQFATLGEDGRLLLYDYKLRKMILKKEFLFGGRCLLWLPLSVGIYRHWQVGRSFLTVFSSGGIVRNYFNRRIRGRSHSHDLRISDRVLAKCAVSDGRVPESREGI